MGRKKKFPIVENLEIIDIAAEGKSIAKIDNMVVFVPGMIPGDVVDVQITRKRRNYLEGYAIRLKKKSDIRIAPFCKHFGICGGCKWQELPYEKQLYYKQKQVSDNLQRIGKIVFPKIGSIIGSKKQQYYRNKLEFTFSDTRWLNDDEVSKGKTINDRRALGFHISGKFDRVLNIDECFLQEDLSNRIRNAVLEFTVEKGYSFYNQRHNEGFMRNLIIRNTQLGEWMVVVVFQQNNEEAIGQLMQFIKEKFPEINSLIYIINPKVNDTINDLEVNLFSGRDHIFEELDRLKFKIRPKSFFQTNTQQATELYRTVLNIASLKGNELLFDFYTGTGTIANYVAHRCKKVIGIEYMKDAIEDAEINAKLNNIGNVCFIAGDVKDVLNDAFIERHGRPDVIITDPPRAGMHADVVKTILKALPARIIYVSCNPATQARDIQLLTVKYKISAVQPIDMFPHTHHVENIVRLDFKDYS